MTHESNPTSVITNRAPSFLLGRRRTLWKGVMVRRDDTGNDAVRRITSGDVTGRRTLTAANGADGVAARSSSRLSYDAALPRVFFHWV